MSDASEARSRLVSNEQIKLTANLLNSLASGATIAGFLGPIASALYNLQLPASPYWLGYIMLWTVVAIALHFAGRLKLKDFIP